MTSLSNTSMRMSVSPRMSNSWVSPHSGSDVLFFTDVWKMGRRARPTPKAPVGPRAGGGIHMAVGTIEDQPFVTCAARCVCSKKNRAKKTRRPAAALLDKGKILEKKSGGNLLYKIRHTHPCS